MATRPRVPERLSRSSTAVKLLLGILILTAICLIVSENLRKNAEQASEPGARQRFHPTATQHPADETDDPAGFKRELRKPAEPPPTVRRDVRILKDEIKTKIRDFEKSRCRTLANFSNDLYDHVLVAVDPPTDEEKKEVRNLMGSLLRECEDSQRQDFDRYLTELDRNYDPLGKLGKRAFFVIISQGDGVSRYSAYSFQVEDFETLPEMLDPKGGKSYKMKNARWYQNPKGGIVERLSHIMR